MFTFPYICAYSLIALVVGIGWVWYVVLTFNPNAEKEKEDLAPLNNLEEIAIPAVYDGEPMTFPEIQKGENVWMEAGQPHTVHFLQSFLNVLNRQLNKLLGQDGTVVRIEKHMDCFFVAFKVYQSGALHTVYFCQIVPSEVPKIYAHGPVRYILKGEPEYYTEKVWHCKKNGDWVMRPFTFTKRTKGLTCFGEFIFTDTSFSWRETLGYFVDMNTECDPDWSERIRTYKLPFSLRKNG